MWAKKVNCKLPKYDNAPYQIKDGQIWGNEDGAVAFVQDAFRNDEISCGWVKYIQFAPSQLMLTQTFAYDTFKLKFPYFHGMCDNVEINIKRG